MEEQTEKNLKEKEEEETYQLCCIDPNCRKWKFYLLYYKKLGDHTQLVNQCQSCGLIQNIYFAGIPDVSKDQPNPISKSPPSYT